MYHSLEISLTINSNLRSDLALDHLFPPSSLVSCQSTPLTILPSPLGQSSSHVLSLTVRQTTLGRSSSHDRPLTLRRIPPLVNQPSYNLPLADLRPALAFAQGPAALWVSSIHAEHPIVARGSSISDQLTTRGYTLLHMPGLGSSLNTKEIIAGKNSKTEVTKIAPKLKLKKRG